MTSPLRHCLNLELLAREVEVVLNGVCPEVLQHAEYGGERVGGRDVQTTIPDGLVNPVPTARGQVEHLEKV
jgi:hypothetical protein